MVFDRLHHPLPRSWLPSGPTGLASDEVFELLRNKRRRYAFHYLRREYEPVPLGELSNQIAAWEQDVSPEDVTSDEHQRVYVSLLQTHLPKMEEADVVEFDRSDSVVKLSENAADLAIYLEFVPNNDILWAQYYLGLTAISACFVGLVGIGIQPFAAISRILWLLIVLAFGVSAVSHHLYLRERRLGTRGPPPE